MLIDKVEVHRVGAVPVELTKLAIHSSVLLHTWTPKLNGVNTYGTTKIWSPSSSFDIILDMYLYEIQDRYYYLLDGRTSGEGYLLYSGASKGISSDYGGEIYVNGVRDAKIENPGYYRVEVKNASGGIVEDIARRYSNSDHFKGQIHSIKLIDHSDSRNSRFYSLEKQSAESRPPFETIVDQWGDGTTNITLYNLGDIEPSVPKLNAREVYLADHFNNGHEHGINVNKKEFSPSDNKISGQPPLVSDYQIGAKLIAKNDAIIRVTSNTRLYNIYDVVIGESTEIQQGFGYPNPFLVINPDDPDYEDYPS